MAKFDQTTASRAVLIEVANVLGERGIGKRIRQDVLQNQRAGSRVPTAGFGKNCQLCYAYLERSIFDRIQGMPTRNVNLTDHYDRFVKDQVASGQFKNASEVMRAGLRLLEQRIGEDQEKLAALRALAAEGFDQLDQGRGITLDGQEQLAAFLHQIGRRAAKQAAAMAESK